MNPSEKIKTDSKVVSELMLAMSKDSSYAVLFENKEGVAARFYTSHSMMSHFMDAIISAAIKDMGLKVVERIINIIITQKSVEVNQQ